MSEAGSSKISKSGAGDGGGDARGRASNSTGGPGGGERERVLKEVGITSTAFIGPAFPPKADAAKSDIEDSLNEFYKELNEIDARDGADAGNPEGPQSGLVPVFHKSCPRNPEEVRYINRPSDADAHLRGRGPKQQQPWPHWYQNEPYHHRRPKPDNDTPTLHPWRHPQPLDRPNPAFHRPPFHRPPPPNPQNRPPHANSNWHHSSLTHQYEDQSHFPPFPRFPPADEGRHPARDFHGDASLHLDRGERGYAGHAAESEDVGWYGDAREEWSHVGDDYDSRRRFEPENELWEQQHHCRPPDNTHTHQPPLVLILMRGLPGSGKTTLARELLFTGPSGLILSTDDYFHAEDGYRYEPDFLGVAHEWNQSRAKDAMHDGRSPVIIDNTNIQAWEMKPYVKMALERGYRVDFCEPNTSWKFDPYELERRNKHGVPQEKIAQMLDRFAFPISVHIVMSSQEPLRLSHGHHPARPQARKNRDFL